MIRFRSLIALCACIVASVGCSDEKNIGGPGPSGPPLVSVELRGRLIDADGEGFVGNLLVAVSSLKFPTTSGPGDWRVPKDTTTSGGDGTFTLPLKLRADCQGGFLKVTGPGYDEQFWSFEPNGPPATVRLYSTVVIRPGESTSVRVDPSVSLCSMAAFPCRRVVVEGSPGEPVQLEIVPNDSGTPMGLVADKWDEEPVPSLTVAPGTAVFVYGPGIATLRARR